MLETVGTRCTFLGVDSTGGWNSTDTVVQPEVAPAMPTSTKIQKGSRSRSKISPVSFAAKLAASKPARRGRSSLECTARIR